MTYCDIIICGNNVISSHRPNAAPGILSPFSNSANDFLCSPEAVSSSVTGFSLFFLLHRLWLWVPYIIICDTSCIIICQKDWGKFHILTVLTFVNFCRTRVRVQAVFSLKSTSYFTSVFFFLEDLREDLY